MADQRRGDHDDPFANQQDRNQQDREEKERKRQENVDKLWASIGPGNSTDRRKAANVLWASMAEHTRQSLTEFGDDPLVRYHSRSI